MMEETVFHKILTGEIPSYCVYEDDVVYAFLDITQTTKGHTLVIPKRFAKDIFDYDVELASEVFARIPKIARALEKAFPNMQGLNIVNNNRETAYQSVFYSHIHLIPRYDRDADGFSLTFKDNSALYTSKQMQEIAHKIRQEINNEA